jgi:acyl dehydratase
MEQEMYFETSIRGKRLSHYEATASRPKRSWPSARYDPQPFHIDEAAGRNSFLSGLTASGWLTAAIVMRLRVESINVSGGMIGAGVEEMRWTHSVRPDDRLRTLAEILETSRLASRPDFGVIRSRTTVFNQRNEVVMKSIVNWLAPLRNA